MKRKALLRHLNAHGCIFLREGGQHNIYRHVANQKVSTVPRHTDINAELARKTPLPMSQCVSRAALGFRGMTGFAQRLEIGRIPEQRGIAAMRRDVIDVERQDHAPASHAHLERLCQDLLSQPLPAHGVVPAADLPIRALLSLGASMVGAAPEGDQR